MSPFKRFSVFGVCIISVLALLISCTKEFPRRMAVLTLPIDSVLAMAKGHIIDMGEGVESYHLYRIIQPLRDCGFSPFLTEGFTHGY